MRNFVLVLFAVFTLVFSVGAVEKVDLEKEKTAIEKATLDYIEGYFSGNVERMDRALSPDLTKKGVRKERGTGQTIFSYASKHSMMVYTAAGYGKSVPEDKWGIELEVLDIYADIACVKVLSAQFMDYLHLAKDHNGEWKIVNVLWTANRATPPPPPPPAPDKDSKKK